jgi:hypothetical protein
MDRSRNLRPRRRGVPVGRSRLDASGEKALRAFLGYADAVAFSGFASGVVDELDFSDGEFLVDELDFSDDPEFDSDACGRLSVMYQPEPLKTTPTG